MFDVLDRKSTFADSSDRSVLLAQSEFAPTQELFVVREPEDESIELKEK